MARVASANRKRSAQPDAASAVLRQLRVVRLFAALDEGTLREIAQRGVPRSLARGARLFRKGERCRGLHIVLEVRIEIYVTAPDGREQVLHRIGARQAVTELPLFDGAVYPASARAATPTRLLFVPAAIIERLAEVHPALLRVVIADLGRSIRRLTRLVEKVSLKDVRARVASALLEQAWAAGDYPEGRPFRLTWTQEEMAHALGVTRESVARGLARLRREGLIQQGGRSVRILDLAGLSEVAEGKVVSPIPSGAGARAGSDHAPLDGPCC